MFYLLAGTSLCENTWYSQVYWADTLYISAKRWCTSTILLAVDTPKSHFCHTYHGSRCISFSASNNSYGYLQRQRQRLTWQLHMQCLNFIIEDHCYDDLNVKHSKNYYEQEISASMASISFIHHKLYRNQCDNYIYRCTSRNDVILKWLACRADRVNDIWHHWLVWYEK